MAELVPKDGIARHFLFRPHAERSGEAWASSCSITPASILGHAHPRLTVNTAPWISRALPLTRGSVSRLCAEERYVELILNAAAIVPRNF